MEEQTKRKILSYDRQIMKDSVNMAWPAIVESFFVAFAGLVDSFMVSSLGKNAVAAVGLTTQPKFVGMSLFIATGVSMSALVARRRGQDKKEDANRVLITALVFIVLAAIAMSVLLVSLASPIIGLCGSTPETHDMAVDYFSIIMGGMIFNCIQIGINSAQRGAGNTKITMRTNVTSNLVNIVFNYLLIGGHFGFPALGIRGAALATVLGTVVSCIMSICSLLNKDGFISFLYIIKNKIKPCIEAFVSIVKVGYSVFCEQLLMRVGFMLTAIMAADMGTDAMAAHQVGMNIMGLSFSFGDGLQSAAVALIGRSLGQGKPDLAKEYGRTCKMLGGCISAVLALIYFLGARWLYSMFFKEEQIVEIGVTIMYIMIVTVIFQIRQVIYMGCLRGAGDTLYTAISSTISVSVIRTIVSYVCGYTLGLGITGIWLGVLGDQISRFTFASIRFKQGKWTEIKI